MASGGGSLLLVAALGYVIPLRDVALVVSIAGLIAGLGRVFLSWRSIERRVTLWYVPG
jgi:hypothetical protein